MDLFLITGGSRGLGQALVLEAAQAGHKVLAFTRTALKEEKNIKSIHCRLEELERMEAAMEIAFRGLKLESYSSVHLINNAGVVDPVGFVEEMKLEEVKNNIEVNLLAPIMMTTSFLKRTRDFQGFRTIVNVSSGVATHPKANWSAYSAAKAGLRAFSLALADELEKASKTKVLSFSPGIMDTEMQAGLRRQSEKNFPDVQKFIDYKEQGHLLSAEVVAKKLIEILSSPQDLTRVDVSIRELLERR